MKGKHREIVVVHKIELNTVEHVLNIFSKKEIEGQFDEADLDKYDTDSNDPFKYQFNCREQVENYVRTLIGVWTSNGKQSCIIINNKNMKFTFTDQVHSASKGGNLHSQSDLSWLYPTKSILQL